MDLTRPGYSKIPAYCLLIAVVAISFLFSPRPKPGAHYCGQYIPIGEHMGFIFNCDAADYCMSAQHPSRILGDSAVRQSRPTYILLASALGYPLQWIASRIDIPLFHSMGEEAAGFIGFYAAFVLINFISLLLCLLLFEAIAVRLTGRAINNWLLFSFGILLVSHPITKAFFWTAHQQFFSLLMPLVSIRLSLHILEEQKTLKHIGSMSFLSGLLMLVYGNFIVMFAAIFCTAFMVDRKIHLVHSIKNCLLFLLPTALWVAYCIYINGHYYNHEVAKYQQLVWIPRSLQISFSVFLRSLRQNIGAYMGTFREIIIFIVPAILSFTYLWGREQERRPQLLSLVITGLLTFVFFLLLGFYEERLTYSLLPVLLCITWFGASRSPVGRHPVLFIIAAIGWHIYNVFSYGPFS